MISLRRKHTNAVLERHHGTRVPTLPAAEVELDDPGLSSLGAGDDVSNCRERGLVLVSDRADDQDRLWMRGQGWARDPAGKGRFG